MKKSTLALFFVVALVATWFASVPQATMLMATPAYRMFGLDTDHVWIANIFWTPIAGAPLSVAGIHGRPGAIIWIFALWAFIGVPLVGATLATWLLCVLRRGSATSRQRHTAALGLALWFASLFLAVPIPDWVPIECGFWFSTY